MAIVYRGPNGKAITFDEALGEIDAGKKSLIVVKMQSTYASDVVLDVSLLQAPSYVKLVNYSKRLSPQEVGAIEIEVNAPEDITEAPKISIERRVKLVGR